MATPLTQRSKWIWLSEYLTVLLVFQKLKLKIINVFNFVTSDELKGGKGVWFSCKLSDECNNIFMITSLRLYWYYKI